MERKDGEVYVCVEVVERGCWIIIWLLFLGNGGRKGQASWKTYTLESYSFLQLSHLPACPQGGWGKGKSNQPL